MAPFARTYFGDQMPGDASRQCRGCRRATAVCVLHEGPRAANEVAADGRPQMDGVIGGSGIRPATKVISAL
jgi:hypothetical protein